MNRPSVDRYRLAREHDAREMARMSRELIEAGLSWRYTSPRMKALIADPDSLALLAVEAASIRGFAVMHFGDDEAHLNLLCVQPSRQRRGIGRGLLEWLLASARVAGMASVRLELRADNSAALAFYRRLEFAEIQTLPAYYDGLIPARRMLRVLRAPAP